MIRRSILLILAGLLTLLVAVPAGAAAPADLFGVVGNAIGALVDGVTDPPEPLVPDFTFSPMFIVAGEPVVFDASATHGGVGPYTFGWDWNDDGVVDEITASPVTTHTFATAQVGSLTLTVTPSGGDWICVTKFFIVEEPAGTVTATAYYDANANHARDAGEVPLAGWRTQVLNGGGVVGAEGRTGVDGTAVFTLPAGTYMLRQVLPSGAWMATTPTSVAEIAVTPGGTRTVTFGALCLGAGGGLGPGFWSSKNGEKAAAALDGKPGVALYGPGGVLGSLHLKDGAGADFAPADYGALRAWLTTRNGVDMRYQASAQLAAMTLAVLSGRVGSGALVYAGPALGFRTVGWLLDETGAVLSQERSNRAVLESLKNALAGANSDQTFVRPGPAQA